MYVSTRGVRGEPFGCPADTVKGRLSTSIGDTRVSLRVHDKTVYVASMQMTEKSRLHFKVTV